MSINAAQIHSSGQPQLVDGEILHFSQHRNVKIELERPRDDSGQSGYDHLSSETGSLYLTNIRFIYISSKAPGLILESLVVPLECVREAKLEQPWFSPMYFTSLILPVRNGGLLAPAQLKFTFPEGGGAEFHGTLARVTQALAEHRNGQPRQPPGYTELPAYLSEQSINLNAATSISTVQGNYLPSYDVALTAPMQPPRETREVEVESEEWVLLDNVNIFMTCQTEKPDPPTPPTIPHSSTSLNHQTSSLHSPSLSSCRQSFPRSCQMMASAQLEVEVQDLRSRISRLKVNELKNALRQLGESQTGVKNLLQNRLLLKLEGYVQSNNSQGVQAIRQALGLTTVLRPAPYPTNPIVNRPAQVPSISTIQAVSNAAVRSPSAFSPMNLAGATYGSSSSVNNLKFKYNPYYESIRKVTVPRGTEAPQRYNLVVDFILDGPTLEVLNLSGKRKADGTIHDTYKVYFSMTSWEQATNRQINETIGCQIEYPANISLGVNGNLIPPKFAGLKDKPWSAFAQDITKFINLRAPSPTRIMISWMQTLKKYVAVVELVKKVPLEEMVAKIKQDCYMTKEQVLSDKRAHHDDDDLAEVSITISLKDPVSKLRINVPARPRSCNHTQCFDLLTFFQLNETSPKFVCPICNKKFDPINLIVDGYFDEMLKATNPQDEKVDVDPKTFEWKVDITQAEELSDDEEGELIKQSIAKEEAAKNQIVILDSSDDEAGPSVPKNGVNGARFPVMRQSLPNPAPQRPDSANSSTRQLEVINLDSDEEDSGPVPWQFVNSF